MDAEAGGDKTSADKLAAAFLDKLVAFPVSPVEFMQPQLVTAIENMANYKFYWRKNIVPQFMLSLPAEDQYLPHTPEAYRAIGEQLGVSPLKVEHTIRSGISPVIDETIRFYESVFGGGQPIRRANQVPGISTRMQREPMGYNSRSVAEVAEKGQQFQQTISSLKRKHGLDPSMTLFDATSLIYSNQGNLSDRDRKRFLEAIEYAEYYSAMSVGDNSIEKLFDHAKEARRRAFETRAAEDWAVVDEILRAMVARAQEVTQQRGASADQ